MRYRIVLGFGVALLIAVAGRVTASPDRPRAAFAQTTPLTPVPCENKAWTKADRPFNALIGAKAFSGEYAGGMYHIEIPDNWNGELVLWAHGYTSSDGADGLVLTAPNVPLRQHLIPSGFAWASSSYRCNGYVPGQGLVDTLALRELFVAKNDGKAPKRTYLVGASMGGHIALLAAHALPTTFDGTLAMCPAGPDLFDFFAATGAAAELISGVTVKAPSVQSDLKAIGDALGKPPEYTEKGRQLASVQIQISGGPRPFALEGLQQQFTTNYSIGIDALVSTSPTPWHRMASNDHTTYTIDAGLGLSADVLNARAPRKHADAALRAPNGPYREVVPFDGRIVRPLLTMHTTGDLYVPIFLEQVLKRAVTGAGKDDLLVQRIYRAAGHCTFSPQETTAAFDALVTWVRDGKKPAGDVVFGDLSDAGRQFTNPLRPNDPGTLTIKISRPAR